MLMMFRRLELGRDDFISLFARARGRDLVPFSTPADGAAVDLLDELGVPVFKIGSDDLVYTPFLSYVASKGKPIILSAGMADDADIDRAVECIRAEGNDRVILLHCVSEYPTPASHANLRKIPALQARFGVPVGFSDHTLGLTAALAAVALGACIVEKHFTLDRSLPGPDHYFSATPDELTRLITSIRELEAALGSSDLVPTPLEAEMAALARRSIVVSRDVPAGQVLTMADLAFRRPGTGLMPYELDKVLGRATRERLSAGTRVSIDALREPD
jgi:sialic acid synthase SpsE